MQLLGNYVSNLNSYYYSQLLSLVSQSIALGEYSSGAGFDTSAVTALQQQGQDFSSLPLPSAGDRILDDAINNPLNLLTARFTALQQEVADFNTRAANLTTILNKETALLDQLLAATAAESWSAGLPQLGQATRYAWDFSGGLGAVSLDIPSTDPLSLIQYTNRPTLTRVLDTATGVICAGAAPTFTGRTFEPSDLEWDFSSTGQVEELSGPDWTELSILEALPTLIYGSSPQTFPSTPQIQVIGKVPGGIVPVTVNLTFIARRRSQIIQFTGSGDPLITAGETVQLSPYNVQADETSVLSNGKVYLLNYDFTVSETGSGVMTSVDLPAGVPLTVYFTEFYPAYQCSVNQVDWSSPIMLDATRPYPDGTQTYLPISFQSVPASDPLGPFFPVTDELGVPTGLFLRIAGVLVGSDVVPVVVTAEQKFQVTTPASSAYGEQATLTITPGTPAYMTGITISPFATFPAVLTSVVVNGVITEGISLFSGAVLIDRETTINFPRAAVRQLILTFTQENYTLKSYAIEPPNQLRKDTLTSVQAALPFAVRNTAAAIPTQLQGALYEFGFENIQGVDAAPLYPCVLVTGPFRVKGTPQIARLDTGSVGTVASYLDGICYSSAGVKLVALTESALDSGEAIPIPFPTVTGFAPSQVGYTDFYLKFVLSSSDAIVERFFLQVSTHV